MSQRVWTTINPLTTSGVMLAGLLDDFKDAIMTGFAGTSRPSTLQAGGLWIDTTNQAAPNYYWAFKFYTGSVDVEIFRISILNGFGGTLTADSSFTVQEIAADAVGPILELIKNRIANNGQVLTGDTVAELRFTGRTDTGTDPTVAYLKYIATDNMTSSAYGGTFSLYSTPDASATITEHLKFIDGMVETTTPHKINSLQPVSQNVATAASIAQLSASKTMVEMTGATGTNIHGINSSHDSKILTIHNRSSADVVLKHQSGTGAASDRMKLPFNLDVTIVPEGSAFLYYCSTDTKWKLLSATSVPSIRTLGTYAEPFAQVVIPAGINRVRVIGYQKIFNASHKDTYPMFTDTYGNAYAWGLNSSGGLGLGDITPRSSPVAVLGGLQFTMTGPGYGIATNGSAYMWGLNSNGQLGVGDVTARSSPVAVLGGLKFNWISKGHGAPSTFALTEEGSLYAWGANANGQLGVGDVTPRSSPVAVLGGLKFARVITMGSGTSIYGLTKTGALYAWGSNANGGLGVGDVAPRSSPVAVLGGLAFTDVIASHQASFGLLADGTPYAWGFNDGNHLGIGESAVGGATAIRSSPIAVLGGLKFSEIVLSESRGRSVVALVKGTGQAYAWGINTDGALGVGDTVRRSSPVAVLGGLFFETVKATSGEGFQGLSSEGIMYAWGTNDNGQLGVGDVTGRSSPVAVLGGIGFGARKKQVCSCMIEVSGGSTYDLILGSSQSRFGATVLGVNVECVTIEYES